MNLEIENRNNNSNLENNRSFSLITHTQFKNMWQKYYAAQCSLLTAAGLISW